ncbi:MAG: right-handed parallel beta-helix repeat-containing protein [Planctomycetota bacterium]|jgi:uncharacterized protein YjbI with pentapeptide repeats|nr:right-handed parallel beta-helix repeat-containing protein [Planctomycetota bacterium]
MTHVNGYGATGDGTTDDTDAILHAIKDGGGHVTFGRGSYRISKPLDIPLNEVNRTSLDGSHGTAKLVMAGAGPAIRLVGTHEGTADPGSFRPEIWQRQRLPQVMNLEIEGAHPEADGIELVGTMQPVISGVSLRELRHGIRIYNRNRNVLISDCQIYHNTGVGIFLDRVNLHQINIIGNHISYCRLGGVRIQGSEVRNLQITGNDIEYNNFRSHKGAKPDEPSAEIFIDTRGKESDSPRPSVREITIASNTIQSTHSPNGANIRIAGPDPTGLLPPGMAAISGNLIGNQNVNIHLAACRGVSITGNFIYMGYQHNLLVENSDDISIGANTIGHNYWREGRLVNNNLYFVDSTDCTLTGLQMRGAPTGKTDSKPSREHKALIELVRCKRINLSGCLLRDPTPAGIDLEDCSHISMTGCQILDSRETKLLRHAVHWRGKGDANLLANNTLDGTEGSIKAGHEVTIQQAGNL